MTLRPTRASSERFSSESSAWSRCWLAQAFRAALKVSGLAFVGRSHTWLVTCPFTTSNGRSLPAFTAWAASM